MAIEQPSQNFEELLSSSDLPLLAVFYSPWDGPSHLLDSVLKQVDDRMQQELKIVKIENTPLYPLAIKFMPYRHCYFSRMVNQ